MTLSLYAGLLAIIYIVLSIHVIKTRRLHKVALGDDNNHEMKRYIRAHSNFAEYTPIFLILLGLAEYGNLPVYAIHFFGIVFLVGRIMHAFSLTKSEKYVDGKIAGNPIWRIRGMICTFSSIGLLSAIVIVQYIMTILHLPTVAL